MNQQKHLSPLKELFRGTGTALISPLNGDRNKTVCWEALKFLIRMQIEGRVECIFPMGTTGGASMFSLKEHIGFTNRVIEWSGGEIQICPGVGGNDTKEAEALAKAALAGGARYGLAVVPYYVKPTQEGIKDYFKRLRETGLEIVAYNIPSRTGGEGMLAETTLELAHAEVISGFKWASGNFNELQTIIANRPKNFRVFCGDDSLTLSAMALGADGVISVASNIVPTRVVYLVNAMLDGSLSNARQAHYTLLELMEAMFKVTNPISVVTALALMYPKIIKEVFRSPLCPMPSHKKTALVQVLKKYNLIKE